MICGEWTNLRLSKSVPVDKGNAGETDRVCVNEESIIRSSFTVIECIRLDHRDVLCMRYTPQREYSPADELKVRSDEYKTTSILNERKNNELNLEIMYAHYIIVYIR